MTTLKNLVDEIATIKGEIVDCYVALNKNLVDKDVGVSETDKLKDLIDKVSNIESGLKFASGFLTVESGNKVDVTVKGLEFKPHFVIMSIANFVGNTVLPINAVICMGDIADAFPANYMFTLNTTNLLDKTIIDGTTYYMKDGEFKLRHYKATGITTSCYWLAVGL